MQHFFSNRIELGLRLTDYRIVHNERGQWVWDSDNYLGSINRLEKDDDAARFQPFLNIKINDYLAVGASNDKIRVAAIKRFDRDGEPSGKTDGTLVISGPVVYGQARLHNPTIFTPYMEAGIAFYRSSFEHDPDWRDDGVHTRLMVVEDANGLTLSLGCSIELQYGIHLDFFYRFSDVEVKMDYFLNDEQRLDPPRESAYIPMEHYTYGMGLKYVF